MLGRRRVKGMCDLLTRVEVEVGVEVEVEVEEEVEVEVEGKTVVGER